jgi:hypothetical protein
VCVQGGAATGKAGAVIGEAVNGIRTVATLTLEKRLVANYQVRRGGTTRYMGGTHTPESG